MAKARVVGYTPQLGKALSSLIHNGLPPQIHNSKAPGQIPQKTIHDAERNQPGIISFYNESDEVIPRYTAVSITGEYSPYSLDSIEWKFEGECVVSGKTAKDDTRLWGISLDEVAPEEFGRLQVSGVVPAWYTGTGRRVTPGNIGLVAGESGIGEVVVPPTNYNGEYKENSYPGIIVLRGSAAKADSYSGTFKLQAVSPSKVEVIHGIFPDSDICGYSDVPGFYTVPRMSLELAPDKAHAVLLYFDFDQDKKVYSAHLASGLPEGILLYRQLGYFSGGTVTQSFRGTDMLRFGDDFYLYAGDE